MKKKLRIFLLILFASLLCGVSLVACRFAKAEDGQPAIADIYQDGRIIRTVHLPGWPQHPQEIFHLFYSMLNHLNNVTENIFTYILFL